MKLAVVLPLLNDPSLDCTMMENYQPVSYVPLLGRGGTGQGMSGKRGRSRRIRLRIGQD